MSLDIISNPWFWAWAIPACILTGISKSGLGGGVGGYTVPLMSMAISPIQAAAIALPVLCVIDLAALRAWWGKWDKTIMRTIMPGGILGIVAGGVTFSVMNEHWIRIMIGAISIGYLGWNLLKLMNKTINVQNPMGKAAGAFWATVSGYTSTIAHAGGPAMAVYLLSQRIDKGMFVATSVVFFAVVNYLKIIPYVWLGLFDTRNILTSLLLIPFGIIGTRIGIWLHNRISQSMFYVVIYALLGFTGAKMLWDGIRGLQ